MVVVLVLGVWLGDAVLGKRAAPAAAPALPPGTFRASPGQMKTLTVESVGLHGFVSEELTEGKIAANGDRATPVFSPYSGRITRVIAGLGDTVKAGAPLATLEASEFVQAQNDLATAAAQVKLARITETRKHALYDAKGGSLQDWQSAQTDLTAAETALSAVRNRLRILGKSPAEIAALERNQTISRRRHAVRAHRRRGGGSTGGTGPICASRRRHAAIHHRRSHRACGCSPMCAKPTRRWSSWGSPWRCTCPLIRTADFKARLTYVSAVVDPVTHRLPVRAEIGNRDGALKPEMFANFRILTSDASESPAVPQSAVVYEGDAAHVWVVGGRRPAELAQHPHGTQQRRLDRGARWIEARRKSRDQGRTFHRSSGGSRLFMNAIVSFALRQRVLIIVVLSMVLAAGAASFLKLNIEAYPDPVPPLVDIVTQSSGQSAEEIERYITIPLEIQMAGIPNVQAIRTISLFGLSDVKVQFTYDFTYTQAEQWVTNRLSQLGSLPNGAQPQISPTSPIGEIYRYRVVGPPNYSVTDLKTLEDWVLERRFKAVPGVIDVTGWGGKTKTYDIAIDQRKLIGYGLSVPQVLQALGNANINVGGQTVNFGAQSAVVRGVGLIHSADEIRHTMIANNQGVPVVIGDVAEVTIGNMPRLGIAGFDDVDDIVQGIVLMRRGAQSIPTIKRVEAEVDKVNGSGILPPGVSIQRIYDRSDLIHVTTRTVLHNMIAGIVLIFLLQWAFLGNLRSAVIVAMTIPFALSFAIGLMVLRGESANLLSVGAIDFGLVVDATVIMVENIYRHLAEASAHLGQGPSTLHRMRVRSGFRGKTGIISVAAAEVSQSIFFAAAIIIAGFVPLFTLSGIEGHIFGPMAKTYAYAIAGGLIATFTIAPALSLLLFDVKVQERETPVVRWLRRVYEPALEFVLANRIITFAALGALALLAFVAVRSLGLEFLPKLEEGNLWVRATFPQSVSLEDSDTYVNRMRRAHGCLSGSASRWSRSMADRTTARMRPAFSTPNSSCR